MALQSTTALATITLQEDSSTVEFSGIPDTYRDLILEVRGTSVSAAGFFVQFNNDTGANYSIVRMRGNGSTPSGDSGTTTQGRISSGDSTNETLIITEIIDCSATDKHKTYISRSNVDEVGAIAGRWSNTSAIHTIKIIAFGTSVSADTTFALSGRIA